LFSKKALAAAGAFFALTGVFEGGFGIRHFFGGVFVVSLWWIRGESWSIDDCFMRV
jgi:hypothetical protein